MTEIDKIEHQDKIQMKTEAKHAIYHCRTSYNTKVITFVWSITNFWDTYNFLDTLTSSNIKGQPFKLQMRIDKKEDKLYFFILPLDNLSIDQVKTQINIQKYNVSIQHTLKPLMFTNWKIFASIADPLYYICLETIRLHEEIYLFNNTLSVCFMFELFENILHNITCENIYEVQTQALTTVTNDFVCDDESNSLITFTIDEQVLNVKKSSLVRVNSTVFNNILNIHATDKEKKIELRNVKYEDFQLLISYLESNGLLAITLNENDTHDSYANKLSNLLKVANQYDVKDLKVLCEKYLIGHTVKDNAAKLLNIAIKANAVDLKNYTKKLIKLYLDDIINTTEFTELVKNYPEILPEILKQELRKEGASYSKKKQ